ncbi:zf-TFIIB domain-containing protein [Cognatishimia sp. F0-27]|uniref:TFIIB-type zinc ribbon-containing protein n=1 Tax=Cognatishimia sp. F0-27 TaxID=2816855 RepID=UPI001D0C8562|nr:zf-TFIIB domain-containing protein [Cognatishimia sp. F0-27]MCC1494696.1 zf-TFIIB domain-containing protein [Cognatishimia sp. F0-27]
MQCPIDGTDLVISERSGVEIDYCPKCRGVWLDRGELDKIIERSGTFAKSSRDSGGAERFDSQDRRKDKRSRKEGIGGFLDDLFDF